MSRVARLNGQQETFEETGMRYRARELVYSSRAHSKWGASGPRRKI